MFNYLEKSGNILLSLTDINARLATIRTGISHIQTDVDKIYTYLKTLATHAVSHCYFLLQHSEVLENKRYDIASFFGYIYQST